MNLKSMIQGSLTAFLLLIATQSFAAAKEVPCPSVDLIKQSWQKLDTVNRFSTIEQTYAVYSEGEAFTDQSIGWHVTIAPIKAKDFNTAFSIGEDAIKNVTSQENKTAMDVGEVYICTYQGAISRIAAIAFKNENRRFKFTSFNLGLS